MTPDKELKQKILDELIVIEQKEFKSLNNADWMDNIDMSRIELRVRKSRVVNNAIDFTILELTEAKDDLASNIWVVKDLKEAKELTMDSANNPDKYPDNMLIVQEKLLHYFKGKSSQSEIKKLTEAKEKEMKELKTQIKKLENRNKELHERTYEDIQFD